VFALKLGAISLIFNMMLIILKKNFLIKLYYFRDSKKKYNNIEINRL
jgi:hypothetical protein